MKYLVQICVISLVMIKVSNAFDTHQMLKKQPNNPYELFKNWQNSLSIDDSKNMGVILATINHHGYPKQRIVSVKTTPRHTFVFHAFLDSDKVKHFKKNNKVSLFFLWEYKEKIAEISIAGEMKTADHAKYKLYQQLEPYEIIPSSFTFTITHKDIKDVKHQTNIPIQYISYEKENNKWKKSKVKQYIF